MTNTRRFLAFVLGASLSIALGVYAQSGGYPTRARFNSIGVGAAPPAGNGGIQVTTVNGIAPADLARLSQSNTFTSTGTAIASLTGGTGGSHALRVLAATGAAARNIAIFGHNGISNGLSIDSDGTTVTATMTGNVMVSGALPLTLNDAAGNLNAAVRLQDAGVTKAWFSLVNAAGQVCTGSAVDDICIAGAGRLTYGPGSGASSIDLTPETGSFTLTFDDACTTSPTASVNFSRVGRNVVWRIGDVSTTCTSDSTAFRTSGAEVPASIRPGTTTLLASDTSGQNNSVRTAMCVQVTTAGNVELTRKTGVDQGCSGFASWTAAGTKEGNIAGNSSGQRSLSYTLQ